jgi:hypothetical protein
MAATVERIEISRRPEDVFTYVLEPLYYREWDDSVVSAHREDPSPLAVGSRCTVEPLNGGRRSRLTIALEIEARGLGKLLLPFARPRARRALPKQLKKLKEILDGGGVIADGRQKPSARA